MKKRALFVGVDQYADQNIQDLHCAVNDATELAGFFKHRAGFDRAEALANPRNGEVVLERVRDMLDGLGGGDEFLFFFAGHGIKTGNGHRLVCAGDQLSEVQHEWAGLPLERLKANTAGAFDRLFLLDACRTDVHATHRGAGGAMEKGTRDLILGSAGQTSANGGELTIVCSCDDGECAGESLSLHHGLFTLAMLELLEEESRLGHRVHANDEFVYGRLPDRMRVLAERSDMVFCQKPQKRGPAILILDGSTDFPEHAADSGPRTGGRVAVPTLVVCPVCGRKNEQKDTFRCRGCNRDNLCLRHQDSSSFLCCECVADRKQKAEAAERARMAREREEVERAKEQEYRERLEAERKERKKAEAERKAREEAERKVAESARAASVRPTSRTDPARVSTGGGGQPEAARRRLAEARAEEESARVEYERLKRRRQQADEQFAREHGRAPNRTTNTEELKAQLRYLRAQDARKAAEREATRSGSSAGGRTNAPLGHETSAKSPSGWLGRFFGGL